MDSNYGVRFKESSGAMAAILRGAKEPFAPSLHQVCAQIFHHEDNGYITVTGIGVSHCLAHTQLVGNLSHIHIQVEQTHWSFSSRLDTSGLLSDMTMALTHLMDALKEMSYHKSNIPAFVLM